MGRTVRKFFWVWDFDKEEKWLNEMSEKGLQLVSVGFCKYVFDEGAPGEYDVRLELLENWPMHPESTRYIKFIEDTGAEYLGSVMRWAYFRKKKTEGGFDLFSDIDSRIKHLNRILVLLGLIGGLELYAGSANDLLYYFRSGLTVHLFSSIFCLLLGVLIAYGFVRICRKLNRLKKERILHE